MKCPHILVTVILLLLMAGISSAQDTDNLSLRIGIDSWPPYEDMTPHNEPVGIAFEMSRAVLEAMDVEIRSVTLVPWSRGMKMLLYGEIDLLLSAIRSPEREARYYFTEEHIITAQWKIFTLCRNVKKLTSIDTLAGKQIGTVRGYEYPRETMNSLRETADIIPVSSDETNFRKLAQDRIDAVLSDYLNGLWILDELGLRKSICIAPMHIGNRKMYPLFSQKTMTPAFVRRFSETMAAFKASPAHADMISRYINGTQ